MEPHFRIGSMAGHVDTVRWMRGYTPPPTWRDRMGVLLIVASVILAVVLVAAMIAFAISDRVQPTYGKAITMDNSNTQAKPIQMTNAQIVAAINEKRVTLGDTRPQGPTTIIRTKADGLKTLTKLEQRLAERTTRGQ